MRRREFARRADGRELCREVAGTGGGPRAAESGRWLRARRPQGAIRATDFGCRTAIMKPLVEGEFRLRNHYLSLDAGFRQWMNADSGDNYMPAMELDAPVASIVLGEN